MPGFDRTGPEGQGSRTGRQMGKCTPKNEKDQPKEEEDRGPDLRRSFGGGRGAGRASGAGRGGGGRGRGGRGRGAGPGRAPGRGRGGNRD